MNKYVTGAVAAACISASAFLMAQDVLPEEAGARPTACEAHPGGKDSNGCHTCKTNCAKWGLSTGEYHCHGGGGSSSGSAGGSTGSSSVSADPGISQAQQAAAEQARIEAEEQARIQEEARIKAEEAARKQAEEQAKIKAAEEARKKAEAEKKDREAGDKEGYNYRLKHPDEKIPALSGKSAAYSEGYQKGFDRGEEYVRTQTLEKARTDAEYAARNLNENEWGKKLPDGVKQNLYLETLQSEAAKKESEYFAEINREALNNSYSDYVRNYAAYQSGKKVTMKSSSVADTDKGRDYYKKQYDSGLKWAKDEIKELKEQVREESEKDASEGRPASDYSYQEYKKDGPDLYKELDQIYQEGYSKGQSQRNIVHGLELAGIVGLAGLGFGLIRRRRRA